MQDFFEHFGWEKDQSLRLIPASRYWVEGEKVRSAELPAGGISTGSQHVRSSYAELRSAGQVRASFDKLCTSSASTWERRHKHNDFCVCNFFGLQIPGK
jgi:hypothetical protein